MPPARAPPSLPARECLVLDDGLQNPGLHKDLSLLVVDGATGFGNGRVLPAGPLREPVAAGAARCQAAVLIGAGSSQAPRQGCRSLCCAPTCARDRRWPIWLGRRVLAFAGIARPEKFFAMLRGGGVIGRRHAVVPGPSSVHRGGPARVSRTPRGVTTQLPVTTPKDAVRLPAA